MAPPEQISDHNLMRRMAQGDELALGALYDRYNALIYSLAMNILGDASTAEEVTLDTFTQAWTNAAKYQENLASVKTWLTAIARNRSIDAVRYKRIRFDLHHPKWADIELDAIPNPIDTEDEFDQREEKNRVQRAISELPKDQKEALALAYFRGYSHSEISRILKKPLGTVKTHIRKAMEQLRTMLE